MRQIRTAKDRARRIEPGYFARRHGLRSWKLILSVAVLLVGVGWISALSLARSRTPYAGPVAASHAAFGGKCDLCHPSSTQTLRAHVTTDACLACHDAPAHKANQTSTPSCASCHRDHRGAVRLASVADDACISCHGKLGTTDGRHLVATVVGRFDGAHPEFAVHREGRTDRTALKFNHEVHLKPELRGPTGPTRLACTDCHVPSTAASKAMGPRADGTNGLMAPVSYQTHCASCHPLLFDRFIGERAPHDKPDIVRKAVIAALSTFIQEHPDQIDRPDPVRGRIPVNFPPEAPPTARTQDEWVTQRVSGAERYLWRTACVECHLVDRPPATTGSVTSLPVYAATNAPTVWLPHARFGHRSHQLATCESCHAAGKSRETSDVLVPSIATCQQCHKPDAADSRCVECHRYHDWSQAQRRPGAFPLSRITGR